MAETPPDRPVLLKCPVIVSSALQASAPAQVWSRCRFFGWFLRPRVQRLTETCQPGLRPPRPSMKRASESGRLGSARPARLAVCRQGTVVLGGWGWSGCLESAIAKLLQQQSAPGEPQGVHLNPHAPHRDNSTSRLAKSSSGPSRRLKWWLQGLSYTLNSFLLSIFTNHCYFPLGLSIIAFRSRRPYISTQNLPVSKDAPI